MEAVSVRRRRERADFVLPVNLCAVSADAWCWPHWMNSLSRKGHCCARLTGGAFMTALLRS